MVLLIIFLMIVRRSNLNQKLTGETGDDGIKDVEIIVSLKY